MKGGWGLESDTEMCLVAHGQTNDKLDGDM